MERNLDEYINLPLDIKVEMTKNRVQEFYSHFGGQVYLSWSGGKDSTVLKHIIKSMDYYSERIPSVFFDTGLEYPGVKENVYNAKNNGENVTIVRPEMTFNEVIETYGYPVISKSTAEFIRYLRGGYYWAIQNSKGLNTDGTPIPDNHFIQKSNVRWAWLADAPFKISEQCCEVMKKKPAKKYTKDTGRYPILGTRAAESQRRRQSWARNGCNAFNAKVPSSKPMSFWTDQDVLRYIKDYNVKIPVEYGDVVYNDKKCRYETTGLKRTGCMFCMFGVHLEKQPNRFQMMKELYPQIYDYCINKLGCGEVLDYIGVPYGNYEKHTDTVYQMSFDDYTEE